MTALAALPPADRIALIERRGEDFPFYRGVPLRLTAGQWSLVLLAVAAGFAALTVGSPPDPSPAERLIRAAFFPGLPLLALRMVSPAAIGAIVRPLRWGDLGVILLCLALGLVVSGVLGTLVSTFSGASANPAAESLATQTPGQIAAFLAATLVQLPGEEFFAIIPFLAVLAWAHGGLGLSRTAAVALAWVVSAVIFGAAHLPTYDWNWVQCLVIIAASRIALTLAYVMTKNLAVAAITHIAFDWLLFGSTLLAATVATT